MARSFVITAAVLCLAQPIGAQQSDRLRLGVFGGKSWIVGHSDPVPASFPLSGASENGHHFGALLELDGAAGPLSLRFDAIYNRLTGQSAAFSPAGRMALLDEYYAVLVGFVLPFRPGSAFSPYLVAQTGTFHSRLGTNPEVGLDDITETRSGTGVGIAAGAGLRFQLRRSLSAFLETRYVDALNDVSGRRTLPITLGITVRR